MSVTDSRKVDLIVGGCTGSQSRLFSSRNLHIRLWFQSASVKLTKLDFQYVHLQTQCIIVK